MPQRPARWPARRHPARQALPPELDAALFTLRVGQIGGVLTSLLGYHLLYCESIQESRNLALEQARGLIRATLERSRKRICQQAWMKQLPSV